MSTKNKVFNCEAIVRYADNSKTTHNNFIVAESKDIAESEYCSQLANKYLNSRRITVKATLYADLVLV